MAAQTLDLERDELHLDCVEDEVDQCNLVAVANFPILTQLLNLLLNTVQLGELDSQFLPCDLVPKCIVELVLRCEA